MNWVSAIIVLVLLAFFGIGATWANLFGKYRPECKPPQEPGTPPEPCPHCLDTRVVGHFEEQPDGSVTLEGAEMCMYCHPVYGQADQKPEMLDDETRWYIERLNRENGTPTGERYAHYTKVLFGKR